MTTPAHKAGAHAPATYTAHFLTCPATGYRLYFTDEDCHAELRNLWYASLKGAKQARARLQLKDPIIVGFDGTVI